MPRTKFSIEIEQEAESIEDMVAMLDHVANLLRQGFTSGHEPTWKLVETNEMTV